MVIDHYFDEYITETARMSLLKAKAASTCKLRPDILILSSDTGAQNRAYRIAINTLAYHDRMFLEEQIIDAVGQELDSAGNQCVQCLKFQS
jgi:hypothetical protein